MEPAVQYEQWQGDREQRHTVKDDTPFTEIYELIYHNRTMVGSELEALLQLVKKKLIEKTRTCER